MGQHVALIALYHAEIAFARSVKAILFVKWIVRRPIVGMASAQRWMGKIAPLAVLTVVVAVVVMAFVNRMKVT